MTTDAQFVNLQRAYDARCEPQSFDDDAEIERVADQLWGTPSMLLDTLAEMIDGAEMERVVPVDRLLSAAARNQVFDPASFSTAQLFVLLMNATNPAQIVAVQTQLRSRLDDVMLASIDDVMRRG